MPTKFTPDIFEYEGQVGSRKQTRIKNYIKGTPKEELFEYINSPSSKPKIVQKCMNELIRRDIKISRTYLEQPNMSSIVGSLR